jgi:hypothetical protein
MQSRIRGNLPTCSKGQELPAERGDETGGLGDTGVDEIDRTIGDGDAADERK